MRAACYIGPGVLEFREIPDPRIERPNDVLVAVEVAGLCGTDLHIVSVPQLHPAKPGIVLGHEFVGRVTEVGSSVSELRPGDRVIAGPNVFCSQCEPCRRGQRNMCTAGVTCGITRDGGFAPLVSVPVHSLYPVPAGLSPESAVFAEPLSCVMNGMDRIRGHRHERTVVLGAGPIGLYFLRVLRHRGAIDLVAVEPIAARRSAATQSGATLVLNPQEQPVVASVLEHTHGGADLVVDTTGFLLTDALAMTRRGGAVLVFGMDQTCKAPIPTFDLVRHEKTILGCFVNNDHIPTALDLIPQLSIHELVTHRFPLDGIEDAIQSLRSGSSIKTLLDVSKAS
jgi:threonine dehydrogenase-like Zn-dependent dehydrogenase